MEKKLNLEKNKTFFIRPFISVWFLAHYGCRCIIQVDAALVVDEEIPPYYVKCFECPEKRYIHVTNYYYKKCAVTYFLSYSMVGKNIN